MGPERVALVGCPEFDDQAAYAAMDFLLASLPEIAERIFSTTANLLNLSCDIIFVDTSSTYFERDVADGEDDLDLAKSAEEKAATGQKPDPDAAGPAESATHTTRLSIQPTRSSSMARMITRSEVFPGNVQHRTGTPSAVAAMPMTTWGRSGRWSLLALLIRRTASSSGPGSSGPTPLAFSSALLACSRSTPSSALATSVPGWGPSRTMPASRTRTVSIVDGG